MHLLNRTFRQLVIVFAAAVLAGFPTANAAYENLWTAGHGDLDIHYDQANNSLGLGYHLDTSAVINGVSIGVAGEAEADYLTLVVPNAPYARRESGIAGLPGVFANQPFWYLSQTNPDPNPVPFLGIGTEEIQSGIFFQDIVTLSLTSVVQAPANGQFLLYRTGLGSPTTFIDTQNLGSTNLLNLNTGTHNHFNFGFSQPGTYLLEFVASGTLVGGGTSSGSAIYAINVVPEPAAWLSMSLAIVTIGAARRWRQFRS